MKVIGWKHEELWLVKLNDMEDCMLFCHNFCRQVGKNADLDMGVDKECIFYIYVVYFSYRLALSQTQALILSQYLSIYKKDRTYSVVYMV